MNETSDDDIREALRTQTEHQLALVPRGPRVVKDTVAYKTTVDRDDTVRRCNLLDPVTVAIALVVILYLALYLPLMGETGAIRYSSDNKPQDRH